MRTSTSARSGQCSATAATSASPSPTVATTSCPHSLSSAARPSRSRVRSSAITTRTATKERTPYGIEPTEGQPTPGGYGQHYLLRKGFCRIPFSFSALSQTTLHRNRRNSGDLAPDDQRLDAVGPLEREDRLHVRVVAGDVVGEQDAVAAEDVARVADDLTRLGRVIHLRHRGHARGQAPVGGELGQPQAQQLHRGDLGEHAAELVLHELVGGDRPAELLAGLRVVQ